MVSANFGTTTLGRIAVSRLRPRRLGVIADVQGSRFSAIGSVPSMHYGA